MSTPPSEPSPLPRRDAPEAGGAWGSGSTGRQASGEAPGAPAGYEAGAPAGYRPGGSVFVGGLVMVILVVVLSWLPLLGPLIAGLAGGWIVAEPRRALFVALLPAIVVAIVVVVLLTAFELPVLGAIAGVGVFLFAVFQMIPLLLGAWVGGALAERSPAGP